LVILGPSRPNKKCEDARVTNAAYRQKMVTSSGPMAKLGGERGFHSSQEPARGNVTAPMIIWAILMAVVIFMVEASHGAHHDALWVGFGATALFGVYLGLRRRVAACFVAPSSVGCRLVPLWIAAMVRDGFFKGLAVGFSG